MTLETLVGALRSQEQDHTHEGKTMKNQTQVQVLTQDASSAQYSHVAEGSFRALHDPATKCVRCQRTSGESGRAHTLNATVAGWACHPECPPHPEDFCHACQRPNIVWHAPNELWNKVMPDDGIVCPMCFVLAAERAGIVEVWRLAPEAYTR